MREQNQFITAEDGVKLHVTVWEAETGRYKEPARDVLLLHGWPSSGAVWRPLAEALLLAENFRLFAPDFRGYGRSDKPEAGFTCQQFARDAQNTAEAMGLKNWALVGHSMGGKIAQVAASAHAPGLSALVLVTPGLLAPSSVPSDMAARRAMFGDTAQIRSLVSGWAAHPLHPPIADEAALEGVQMSQNAWDGWLTFMRGEDLTGLAEKITVPTLVVGGEKDAQRSPADLQTLASQIKGATLVSLPGSGHLPHLEEPESLVALLVNFWDASLPTKGGNV